MTLVFVYGTLKIGERNNYRLKDSEFIGKATTLPKYKLYHNGSYPCLVKSPVGGVAVEGEIFKVSPEVLADLDILEAVRWGLYTREPIELQNFTEPVIGYFFAKAVRNLADSGTSWSEATME